jgi:phosphate transport system substrate-binding protein
VSPSKWLMVLASSAVLAFGVAACGDDDDDNGGSGGGGDLSGTIRIDGSSTVAPITEAVAELFQQENPDVKVTVGTSGTGGGFEKFCAGETDISDASRQIEPEEVSACKKGGIKYAELQVANDALTVVVDPDNPVKCLTVDQLNEVWGPDSKITSWSEIKGLQPSYDEDLTLYSPGSDSGTFDYFTEEINGEEGVQRTSNVNDVGEDDNATVTGVGGSPGGMGYFGFSFYQENTDTLKALEVDGGQGCVAPSVESAQDGSYTPLARALYVYPSSSALEKPEVDAFLQFYLDNVGAVAEQAGFIAMTSQQQGKSQQTLDGLIGGGGGSAG